MSAHRFLCHQTLVLGLACGLSMDLPAASQGAGTWQHQELRRFKAAEANQGVAVDEAFFYAIDNRAIGKYRKTDGERVAGWQGVKEGEIKHLNSGVVVEGKLYCAHSNFPEMPEQSSIEIWDTATMKHLRRHVFQNPPGSLTWAVPHDGNWFACFAHYRRTSDPARSQVVRFDTDWRPTKSWNFPASLIERFAGSSASGGAFGPGGRLFVTGHDARELYELGVAAGGSELLWESTIQISAAGQAFGWDPSESGILYGIERKKREVIVSRIERVKGLSEGQVLQPVTCEGAYPGHLQGVTTDGHSAIYWSWTDALVKTDLKGRLLKKVAADNHHGDLCLDGEKVYVAVNLGKFNEPAGKADSWVYEYDAGSLELLKRHRVPELVHGAGGMAHYEGRFVIIGGLPPGVPENYIYEYDTGFRLVKRHVLTSGYTEMGIQTATWANGAWWFGCYGTPRVVLRADTNFKLTGRWEFDASLGLQGLADGRFLVGQNTRTPGAGHVGRVVIAREDAENGLVLDQR